MDDDIEKKRGVITLTNAVSGQSQNCSGNLGISPGIGTLGNFSGKHAIIPLNYGERLEHVRPKRLVTCLFCFI